LNPKTNQFEPFLNGVSAEYVSYSLDGKYVAYVSFPDGILWRANRDGTGLTQLTRAPFHPKCVRWSPDTQQIAFHDFSAKNVDAVYLVSARGGEPKRLRPEDEKPEVDPHWSPDGKRIAYCSLASDSAGVWNPHPEIHILDLATHHDVSLPPAPQRDIWSPKWSPDGRYVVGINTDQTNLYLFDMESQRWSVLAQGHLLHFPTWSHDGSFVYYLDLLMNLNEAGILRVPIMGGKAELVADLKGFRLTGWYGFWFGLDADDNPLLLRDQGTDEIYALTLER
jgi:Tol biopolymer transport system component